MVKHKLEQNYQYINKTQCPNTKENSFLMFGFIIENIKK